METNVSDVMNCILDCVENQSTYGGFLCFDCGEKLEDEFNENN
jgi:hypothetical protein